MSYPAILPPEAPETAGAAARVIDTVVSSLVLRALTAAVLIGVVARVGATVAGIGDLA
jgi:hypothetical protein